MLPLSGRFAPPGAEVKKGLELALQSVTAEWVAGGKAGAPVTLVFRDTQEDPALTARATQELIDNEHVVGLIGPLVAGTAAAAADIAASRQVPLVVLSQKSSLPQLGKWSFRLFVTPERMIKALVGHAMDDLGFTRFAIVHPEQRNAMDLVGLFWDEVERRGGQLVGIESYAPDAKDFQYLAQKLGGQYFTGARAKEFADGSAEWNDRWKASNKPPPRPYQLPPEVDFDAIFMPEQPRVMAQVASALAFAEIPMGKFKPVLAPHPVTLLGTSAWNNPQLPQVGGDYVEDCRLVDYFFAGSSRPEIEPFVTAFKGAYGTVPEGLAASGYDALNLLNALLRKSGEKTNVDRIGLAARLADVPRVLGAPFAGVTGPIAFDAAGEVTRPLTLLTVHDRVLMTVNEAPASRTPEETAAPSPSAPSPAASGERAP